LPDPLLTVFDGSGRSLADNDDWSGFEYFSSPEASMAAAVQAGAFALVRGSKDAVVLAYLPPGVYTFVVTGKGTATGISLIEVYDLD
jgi:hypothetical protein